MKEFDDIYNNEITKKYEKHEQAVIIQTKREEKKKDWCYRQTFQDEFKR